MSVFPERLAPFHPKDEHPPVSPFEGGIFGPKVSTSYTPMSRILLILLVSLTTASAAAHSAPPPLADSTQHYYATQNAHALERLLGRIDDRALDLLIRYRLYPLTQDADLLDDLPADLDGASARELALLSGLWGYRVMTGSVLKVPTYGRRAAALIERARALDPDEPLVLLIEGQTLLFSPPLMGRDREAALARFQRLCAVLPAAPDRAVSSVEARLWVWYALTKLGRPTDADALKAELLAERPPPLYRTFLLSPP